MNKLTEIETGSISGGMSSQDALLIGLIITTLFGLGALAAVLPSTTEGKDTHLPILIGPFFDIVAL